MQSEVARGRLPASGWWVWPFLMGLTYICNFLFIADYGVYYDDHYSLGYQKTGEIYRFWEISAIRSDWGNGRPLYFFVRSAFFALGGLPWVETIGLYFLGLLLQTSLGFAFYLFFRRLVSHELGFVGAVLYTVYPAFTGQVYLTNALYQLGMIGALVAFHLFLSRERWKVVLAYALFPALVLYVEMYALLFVGVPVFDPKCRHWSAWRKWLLHLSVLALLLLSVILLRRFGAEDLRMTGSSGELSRGVEAYLGLGAVKTIAVGIFTAVSMFVLSVVAALQNMRPQDAALGLGATCFLGCVFWSALRTGEPVLEQVGASVREDEDPWLAVIRDPERRRYAVFCLVGLFLAILGYLLAPFMRIDPSSIVGRETRVHEASMYGICCLLAALWCLASSFLQRRRARLLLVSALALHLGLVTAYRMRIQEDYRDSWKLQQSFYQRLETLVPDLERNTLVIIEHKKKLPRTFFVDAYYGLDVSMQHVFSYPESWTRAEIPLVHFSQLPLAERMRLVEGRVQYDADSHGWRDVEDGNVVVLSVRGERLVRRTAPMTVDGVTLNLKQRDRTVPGNLGPGHFYDLFVTPPRLRL